MTKPQKHNVLILIGIGIFFYWGANNFAKTLEIFVRELLFQVNGIHPVVIFLLTSLFYVLGFVIAFYALLRVLQRNKISGLNLMYSLFGIAVILEIPGFLIQYLVSVFRVESYFDNFNTYYAHNDLNMYFRISKYVIWFGIYGALLLLIVKNKHKFPFWDVEKNEWEELGTDSNKNN